MRKTIVVYKSKYGSTEKYAKWVAEELNADLVEASKAKIDKLLKYDIIVYGGGLYAGGINGVNSCITHNFDKLKNKKLVVFTVGLGKTEDLSAFEKIKNHNFTAPMQSVTTFFHLRGGMDYKKLSFIHRAMMSMMKKMIEKKTEKDSEDELFLKTYGVSVDFTKRETIEPLVTYIKTISVKN